jgi:hypothetical protein
VILPSPAPIVATHQRRATVAMLADQVDAVIGVDTHKRTHTAAVVTPTGGLVADTTIPTDAL